MSYVVPLAILMRKGAKWLGRGVFAHLPESHHIRTPNAGRFSAGSIVPGAPAVGKVVPCSAHLGARLRPEQQSGG